MRHDDTPSPAPSSASQDSQASQAGAANGEAGWLPIETALKDGTHLWLFCPEDHPQQLVGEWIEGSEYALWAYVDACLRDVSPEGPSPTHWMPLPMPPSPKEQRT